MGLTTGPTPLPTLARPRAGAGGIELPQPPILVSISGRPKEPRGQGERSGGGWELEAQPQRKRNAWEARAQVREGRCAQHVDGEPDSSLGDSNDGEA